jgi:hypothetical protein
MLLAATYSTPAVPNQNNVSIGFIIYWMMVVLILFKPVLDLKPISKGVIGYKKGKEL